MSLHDVRHFQLLTFSVLPWPAGVCHLLVHQSKGGECIRHHLPVPVASAAGSDYRVIQAKGECALAMLLHLLPDSTLLFHACLQSSIDAEQIYGRDNGSQCLRTRKD